jgi:predicted phage terminase large subunit-like protein
MSSSGFVQRKIAAATRRYSKPLLPEIAAKRLAKLQATKARCIERTPLVTYASSLAWQHEPFEYFAPYADECERAIGGNLRCWIAAPPQHGKTEFTLRALLWWARFFPGKRHAYVTYNQLQARIVSESFQRLAEEAGFDVTGTLELVILDDTTRIKFTSIEGSLTGYPIDGVCVIDDPIKGQAEAISPKFRQSFIAWWKSTARARRHPGTSFIGMGTRWHVDDPGGFLIKKEGFRYINLKAIAEPRDVDDLDEDGRVISDPLHRLPGEALSSWKTPDFFAEERSDIYWWSAMYQGEPVPMGSTVFAEPGSHDAEGNPRGPTYYRELPKDGYTGAFGLDLAYSSKTHADWSICIEGIAHGGKLYIVDVIRKQVEAPAFALTLKAKASARPGWPMRWYASGTEKGAADFIRRALRSSLNRDPMKVLPPLGDKRVRATSAAAKWNAGDVLLPDPDAISAPWLPTFLASVTSFTGVSDEHDDDVDALAALHDQLFKKSRMFEALNRGA